METREKPRMTGGSHPLPFDKLAPLEFERLCLWLVTREGYERAEHLGEAGSEQGRDVVAWKNGCRVVFQCKRVQAFNAAVAKKEIEKLRSLPAEVQPADLMFVVSRTVSADLRAAIRAVWGDEGSCHFWVGNELDERVKRHPEILREFFQLPPEGLSEESVDLARKKIRLSWGLALSILGIVLTLFTWRCPWSPKPEPPPKLANAEVLDTPGGPQEGSGVRMPQDEPQRSPKPEPLPKPAIYAVRVLVLDSHGRTLEGSKVRVSTQNEPQQTPDGWWEVEIPAAKVPTDGQVTIWANHEEWEENHANLRLGNDPNPRLEIRLKDPESWIRGRVVDSVGRGLPGVRVTRQDGVPGVAITDAEGKFGLKMDLPKEASVRVSAEVAGSTPVDTFCITGSDSCNFELEGK